MSDHNPTSPPDPSIPGEPATPPGRLARWRSGAGERWRRTRKGVALGTAAALLLVGAGGFALGIFVGDRGPGGPGGRGGWGEHPSRFDGPGDDDRQAPPPGAPGQLPPATNEEEQQPSLDG